MIDEYLDRATAEITALDKSVEDIFENLREVRKELLKADVTDATAAGVMQALAKLEEVNTGIRQDVREVQDLLILVRKSPNLIGSQVDRLVICRQQCECIEQSTTFLADRIDFLMTSSVGFISINQNKAIRKLNRWALVVAIPAMIFAFFSMNLPFPW